MPKTLFVDTLSPGDIVGNGFIFVEKLEDLIFPSGSRTSYANFKCPLCAEIVANQVRSIKHKYVLSCGCQNGKKKTRKLNSKNRTLYHSWYSMHKRCYNPKAHDYHNYGAIGATVCDRWHEPGGFERFELDMGEKYHPDLRLDKDIRFPGNKQYDRLTCQWVTQAVNCQHRRCSLFCIYLGQYMRLEEAANLLGLPYRMRVRQWARKGVPKKYQHLVEIVGRKDVI